MSSDGGGAAAFGFRYQYLATAEEILLSTTGHSGNLSDLTFIVEPTQRELGDSVDNDIVDFAIEDTGIVTRLVQVKSSRVPSAINPLRYSDVTKIFARMGTEGQNAVILTNKQLAKKLLKACTDPTRSVNDRRVFALKEKSGTTSPARSVVYDVRSLMDIKQSVLTLIREIRRDRALGQGEKSAALLAALLLDTIFESSADLTPRRFSARAIFDLLGTPDAQIAHALRRFDWGVPLLEVPRLMSAVARSSELGELTGLYTQSVAGRNPLIAVLIGVTGFGKSTIAADFCHLNRHFYEHVTWIDCRADELIIAKIKDTATKLGVDVNTVADVATAFRTEIARIGGPFVLVFDGVRRRQDIERFIPTSGCGFVIVTTTNSTGWWSTANELHIDPFTEDEAITCFETYARISIGTHTDAVAEIVNRLGRVPLAIAMAALHFRNVDEDITRLTAEYFESLDALADPMSIPEGFDRTAFAAVRFAVAQLGKAAGESTQVGQESQALIYHAAFLAPELIPLNLLLQTVDETVTIDLTNPPTPHIADQRRRNGVLANLRTQTMARRRSYVDVSGVVNPASDTINFHPLVHEILRMIHRQLAPGERVIDLLIVLMACTYGWIISLQREGAFFPLEQLLVHGKWVLELVDDVTLPAAADEQQIYVFRCAKLYLRTELANAYASRGEYEQSVDTIEQALDEIEGLSLTVHAQGKVAKSACDAVADVMLGELGADRAVLFARRAATALTKLEMFIDSSPRLGEVIVEWGVQAFSSISRFDTDETREVATQLKTITTRQQVSRLPSSAGVSQVVQHLDRGEFTEARALVRRLRGPNPSVFEAVMYDTLITIADLHLGRWNDAADTIGGVLVISEGSGSHLHTSLQMACTQIGDALNVTQVSWVGHSVRLQQQQVELRRTLSYLSNGPAILQ